MNQYFCYKFFCLGLIALLLSGCGEFSYKRGATAQDLTNTKKACQAKSNEIDLNKCLEDNGWSVHQLNDLDLFAVATVTPNNNNLEATKSEETDTSDNLVIDATKPTSSDSKAQQSKSESKAPESKASSENGAPKTPEKIISPLTLYTVSSWWKMGGGRQSLETNMNECVTKLGEEHTPNHQTQQVTRGLVVCMYEKGWKALKAK